MPLGFKNLSAISRVVNNLPINYGNYGLAKVINNPNPYGTTASEQFGYSVAISNNYFIIGTPYEDDAGGLSAGKAYIYSTSTGSLLYTLDDPNAYGTSSNDQFGWSVGISDQYAIVGAYTETSASGGNSGKAYIFSTATGQLVYTLNNPTPVGTEAGDNFGYSVGISGNYAIVGAYGESDTNTGSGKAYIYSTSTGSLLYTLNNPNPYSTSASDYFGLSTAISNNYAIVGAPYEDDATGTTSGKAYIYSTSTGSLLYTLNNPTAYSTSAGDQFGSYTAICDNYAIVGVPQEDDATGTTSGKAYIYSTSTGSLVYTLNNPNPYSTGANDYFGIGVGISNNYAIVTAHQEDNATGQSVGKAYVYSTSTGSLLYTLNNPNPYSSAEGDQFGYAVGVTDTLAIISANTEDDAGGTNSGKAYLYSRDTARHITATPSGYSVLAPATSLTTTITIPSTVLNGDLLILFDTSTTVTDTSPAGWTSIVKSTTTGIRTNVSYLVASGGIAGYSVTGMAGTTRKVMMVIRNWATNNAVVSSISTPVQQATTNAPTTQNIAAGTAPCIYIACGGTTAGIPSMAINTTNASFVNEFQSISTSGVKVRYALIDSGINQLTPEAATVTMTDAGTNTLQSFRINLG